MRRRSGAAARRPRRRALLEAVGVEPGGQVAAAAPELLLARALLLGQGRAFLLGDDGGVDRLGGRRRSGRGLVGGRGASTCQASQQAVHGRRGASLEAPRSRV